MSDGTLITENIKDNKIYDCEIKTLICGIEFTKLQFRKFNTIYYIFENCYLKNNFKKK